MTSPADERSEATVGDARLVLLLWPVLLAAVVSLLPFTAFSTLVVPIATTVGSDEGQLSGLRGLGGLGAVLAAISLGPVLGRWPHRRTAALGLLVLAAAAVVGALGDLPSLVVMCLLVGAATAVVTPVLLTTATHLVPDHDHARGRAAVLVTATQTLTAVLAAPLLAPIAGALGWQGALLVSAGLAVTVAVVLLRRGAPAEPAHPVSPLPYRQAVAALRRRPDLLALMAVAGLRTAPFMGYLAFLAASYHDRFDLDPAQIALVWALSGGCLVIGNYVTGRATRRWSDHPRPVLLIALGVAAAAVLTLFVTDVLVATILLGGTHAAVSAIVTSLIAQRAGALTTSTYAINGAGMSLGVLCGGGLGAVGLAIGGAFGLGAALLLPVGLGLVVAGRSPAFRYELRG